MYSDPSRIRRFANAFSHSVGFLFLLVMFSGVQRFSILMKSNLAIFFSCAFTVISMNQLPNLRSWVFTLMFSPKSFMF